MSEERRTSQQEGGPQAPLTYDGILPGKGPGWSKAWWLAWVFSPWPITAVVGLWRLIAGARAPAWAVAVFSGWLLLTAMATVGGVVAAFELTGEGDKAEVLSEAAPPAPPRCFPVEVDTITRTYRGRSIVVGPETAFLSGDEQVELPANGIVAIRTTNCLGQPNTRCDTLYSLTADAGFGDAADGKIHVVAPYAPTTIDSESDPDFYSQYSYYWLELTGETTGNRWGTDYQLSSVGRYCAPGGVDAFGQ